MSIRISILLFAFTLLAVGGSARETPKREGSAATMPEPKLFTPSSDKMMLGQALTELAKQTGIRVEDGRGGPDRTIRLDRKQTTFWKAVDALAAASDARVNLYPTSGRIVLDKRGANYRLPPLSYDGRFRLCVKKITAVGDQEVNDNSPDHAAYNAAIEIAWDPALQPLFLETRPHAVRLVDDKNNVHAVAGDGSSLAPVDGLISLWIDVRLPILPRSVARIRSLEGELSMIGPSKMLTFAFDTLDKLAKANADATQEGVVCRISKVILDRQRWTVQVTLRYPPGMKQLDSNQSWVVNNEMTLESLDGKKRLQSSGYVLEMATPRQAVLSYHFRDKDGQKRGKVSDWKLLYRTPANLIEAPIKFSFKDIRLP